MINCFKKLFLRENNEIDENKNKKNNEKIDISRGYISYILRNLNECQECVICLEDMKNNDEIILTECFHMYHKKCLIDWFERSEVCPICDNKIK